MTMNRRDALKVGGAAALIPLLGFPEIIHGAPLKEFCECLKTGKIYPASYAHILFEKTGTLKDMAILTSKPFVFTREGQSVERCIFYRPAHFIGNGRTRINGFQLIGCTFLGLSNPPEYRKYRADHIKRNCLNNIN